jgi:hypothetical protein
MTRDELAETQAAEAVQHIYALSMKCRRRFLRSADLVCMRSAPIAKLRKWGSESLKVGPLILPWQLICHRYLWERHDPQLSLLSKTPLMEAAEAWSQFVYWHLLPHLVLDDEFVRNVLRALGGIPCESPERAVTAVGSFLAEMTLPDAAPPWDPEEAIY